MPIAQAYVPLAVYNLLVTFITGGVSMIIFFFVFKIIFPTLADGVLQRARLMTKPSSR